MPRGPWITLGVIVAGFCVLAQAGGQSRSSAPVVSTTRTSAETFAETRAPIERQMILDARVNVKARLRDGGSAEFGRVYVSRSNMVCGFVNAKNGFGGYTGMQPFIAGFAKGDVLFYQRAHEQHFEKYWKQHCA